MQLSLRSLEDLQSKYEGMKRRLSTVKETAHEAIMTVVQTAEISATAFSLGVVNGYWSQPELIGVPVSAALALGSHLAGFLVDDKGGEHLHNIGDGAFATYFTTLGVGVGAKMQQEKAAAAVAPRAP